MKISHSAQMDVSNISMSVDKLDKVMFLVHSLPFDMEPEVYKSQLIKVKRVVFVILHKMQIPIQMQLLPPCPGCLQQCKHKPALKLIQLGRSHNFL